MSALSIDLGSARRILLAFPLATLFILLTAIARGRASDFTIDGKLRWCFPAWNFPDGAGEALDGEATLLPLAAWLSRSVESSKTCIDGTLICLWAEFMGCRGSNWSCRSILTKKRSQHTFNMWLQLKWCEKLLSYIVRRDDMV